MKGNFLAGRGVCIVAYGETRIDRRTGRTAYELAAEVAEQLYRKTGLGPPDIDGAAFTVPLSEAGNPFWSNYAVDYLGISARWLQTSDIGGASAVGNVARAALAIQNGWCETVMLLCADAPSTRFRADYGCYRNEFWDPVGIQGPPGAFGLLMNRYMARHELDFAGLGALAVAQRNGAVVNPNAYKGFRKKITVADYLDSRMVSTPLRLLDSVMFCDGANGLVMMKTSRARRLGLANRVYPAGYSEITNFGAADQTPDITRTGHSIAGPEAMKMAGLKPRDVDMLHPYDDFLIAVMLKLEQMGFCKEGRGSQFLRDTDIGPKGALPINTGGGQIGCGQPGLAGGGLNLVEAVRQLMGEAGRRQAPSPRNALVTGIGVIPYGRNWGSSAALALEN